MEVEESNSTVELSTDKITEIGQGMHKAIGMTLGEEILEAM